MPTQHHSVPVEEVAPLTDPETLRDQVEHVHEITDTVPASVVEEVAALDDMAAVGVTTDDGVLLRRLTDTCAWKLPVATVGDGEDYVAAIREQVRSALGPVELDAAVGLWQFVLTAEAGGETTSRTFVVFAGTLGADTDPGTLPAPDAGAHDVGWFSTLPENGDEIPGTTLFLDSN